MRPKQRVVRLLNTHPGLANLSCRDLSVKVREYGITAGRTTCARARREWQSRRRGTRQSDGANGGSTDDDDENDADDDENDVTQC